MTKLFSLFARLSCLAALVTAAFSARSHEGVAEAPVQPERTNVRISKSREGDVTRFFVENREHCEITMTFDFHTVNLKSGVTFPHTATFPPRQVVEAFALAPDDESSKWEYSYTNYFKMGSHTACHDDSVVYSLPYRAGASYKVTQAYGGSYSHHGANKYAIDWQMPEGTPVCAARGGVVVKLRQSSDKGGPSMSFDRYNNYVLIRHEDGTLGHYCHLQQNSVAVKLGDVVAEGQQIARSGNTGFSSGPHLHFAVFKTRNGKERVTIPVKFRAEDRRPITLVAGRKYRSTTPDRLEGEAVASREATADSQASGSSGS